MRIVGTETHQPDAGDVHTIDVWYSQRRKAWIVERLDAGGAHVGLSFTCATQHDAEACVAEWLRSHGETHLVGAEAAARRARLRRAA